MAEAHARSREPLVMEFADALDQQKPTLSRLLGTLRITRTYGPSTRGRQRRMKCSKQSFVSLKKRASCELGSKLPFVSQLPMRRTHGVREAGSVVRVGTLGVLSTR